MKDEEQGATPLVASLLKYRRITVRPSSASRGLSIPLIMAAWGLGGAAVLYGAKASASSSQSAPIDSQEAHGAGQGAKIGVHTDMILLTVDKKSLRAELKTWPEDHGRANVLRGFRIAIGKADGDKQIEGDNRTPEGIYFAQNHIDGASLPERYGAMAIPVDYPNPMDKIARKTGHGIWLHGVERDQRIEEAKVTEGCVAFYNADVSKLSLWLRSHQGVVVIANDLSAVNRPDDLEQVRVATGHWMDAWANRDVDAYIEHYADDFRFERHTKKSYYDYKKRVFDSYKVMDLKFDNLRVITHPKYAVAVFNQDFHGDQRYSSIGRKVLYWERAAEGAWKIKREVFENRRFEFVTFTDAELALLSEHPSTVSTEEKTKTQAPNL